MNTSKSRVRMITIFAVFVALSVVGSFIKIPSPYATVAFDSCPAFVAALLLSPLAGAAVGFVGHMATAMTSGFPFSLPIHLIIAVEMMVVSYVIGIIGRRANLILIVIIGTILNGIVSPALFIPIDGFGIPFYLSVLLSLTIGSLANFLLTAAVVKVLKGKVYV